MDIALPNVIEFVEIDVVGPFQVGLEAEESELVPGEVDEL